MNAIALGLLVTPCLPALPQLAAVRREPQIDIVFESSDPRSLPPAATLSRPPSVILADMHMPSGVRATMRALRARFPVVPIVLLDGRDDPIKVQRARNLGVAAVLTRRSSPERFVSRIISIGSPVYAEGSALGLRRYDKLTPRERDILHYLGRRFTAREIADHLTLSYSTVRTHIRNIYAKYGIGSRLEAVRIAEVLLAEDKTGYNGRRRDPREMNYVDVMVEPTPNPNAFKFTLDRAVTEGGSESFANAEQAAANPLAAKLFALEGVQAVFFLNNFVTITRRPDRDWNALATDVVNVIQEHYETA